VFLLCGRMAQSVSKVWLWRTVEIVNLYSTTRSGYLGEGSVKSGVDEITFLYRGKKLWLNKYLSVSCFIIDNY
jgi:hypothetical protein